MPASPLKKAVKGLNFSNVDDEPTPMEAIEQVAARAKADRKILAAAKRAEAVRNKANGMAAAAPSKSKSASATNSK